MIILSMSVGFLLLISGITKFFSINETSQSLIDLGLVKIISLSRSAAVILSAMEVFLAIGLILFSGYLFINISAFLVFLIFILINYKSVANNLKINCNCFGKILKTEYGYGGIIQSLIMIIIIIPNILSKNMSYINFYNIIPFRTSILIIISAFFATVTIILVRETIDLINKNKVIKDF